MMVSSSFPLSLSVWQHQVLQFPAGLGDWDSKAFTMVTVTVQFRV